MATGVISKDESRRPASCRAATLRLGHGIVSSSGPLPRADGGDMSETHGTVLVVDDDASVRESVQDLLEAVGLDVRLYGSVQDFLQAPRPQGPCCLVLDVRLPGKGGLDLQEELARIGGA